MNRLLGLLAVSGWAWVIWTVDRHLRAQAATQALQRRRHGR